uniref:Cyclin n=1 Tax=Kalanchoe fedtschenkoi TaxID=63787 RepID=A0A7N0VLG0_KALFE
MHQLQHRRSLIMESCSILKWEADRVPPLVSSALEKTVQKNEYMSSQLRKLRPDVVTIFHSSRVPPLSIRQYVARIFKYSRCSPSCLVLAFIYIDRFCQRTNVWLGSLNVHRLLIASVLVAAKFVDNGGLSNAYYAKVGGVGLHEMNKMEMKLLFDLDFRLYVTPEAFNRYCLHLENEATTKEEDLRRCRNRQ